MVSLFYLPVTAKIPVPGNSIGSRRILHQFSSVRISRGSRLSLAYRSVAGGRRGHLGHRPMPAKAMELLPWRGFAVTLRRSHDSAHDLVFSSRTLLFGIFLT